MKRASNSSAVDFNITLGGILYLGWLGSYLISLRNLPDGLWWFLLVLPATWFGDGAAYFVGSHFGRHKMSPRVSPKKSWEGYVGGVIGGALFCMLLASLWHLRAPAITPVRGLIVGLVIAGLSPLGDLGESMLKRGFGVKDFEPSVTGTWGNHGPHRFLVMGSRDWLLLDHFCVDIATQAALRFTGARPVLFHRMPRQQSVL